MQISADFDKSQTLSKREFTVMYVGLLAHKAKLGLGTLAGAIATALDTDGDGKIGSTELKALLQVGRVSIGRVLGFKVKEWGVVSVAKWLVL